MIMLLTVPAQASISHPCDFSHPSLGSSPVQPSAASFSTLDLIARSRWKRCVLYRRAALAPSVRPPLPHTSAYSLSHHCSMGHSCLFSLLSLVSTLLQHLDQLLPSGNVLTHLSHRSLHLCGLSLCAVIFFSSTVTF